MTLFRVALLLCFVVSAFCDTPANCSYQEVVGKWTFMLGTRGNDKTLDCSDFDTSQSHAQLNVELFFPDTAVDQYGNEGFWTLIYNQGFELVIGGRKYFAFSKYTQDGKNVTSYCDTTLPGWSHDIYVRDWACYIGKKSSAVAPKHHQLPFTQAAHDYVFSFMNYRRNEDFVNKINSQQNSWKAVHYPEYEQFTVSDMIRRAGGLKSRVFGRPRPAPITRKLQRLVSQLPDTFDWRDVEGINFVSPIRNQASCGSCYAFASMGMAEARLRVHSNNTFQAVFSTQDIVECSEYSQGCEGGFPYLIAGKYGEDFGLVAEDSNPYKGKDGSCSTPADSARFYTTRYRYVGGFYGGCNEALMKLELVKNGPVSVAFEVYPDFQHYKGGIYHHTGLEDPFNPFELTNHAVLLVGYGSESGQDYWIVKNSWGESWGEKGYFRIRRGVDECAMESIAVEATPLM